MRKISIAMLAIALGVASAAAQDPSLSRDANAAFLAANAKKPGVTTAQGIQYRVIKSGTGAKPNAQDCVSVYYKGNLINGTVFDQTQPGQPATFPAGRLIKGWTLALEMMHEGDEWNLVIPSDLAYGSRGAGSVIPPDQTLVFDITLLKVSEPAGGQCS
jgi:FKBP-type peptidyl-prolyl cis-trans isomerase FklB